MDDDLRKSVGLEDESFTVEAPPAPATQPEVANGPHHRLLGMTAPQRFAVMLMVFMLVCVLGGFVLVMAEKVVFPY